MATYLKDLIHIPRQVNRGDFVINLAQGVTDPAGTVASYVLTPQLRESFRNALEFLRGAVESGSSKPSYLHGSFGAGKSHFMAILTLLLAQDEEVLKVPEFQELLGAQSWLQGKRFLLVPYHFLGAESMEAAILGGYVAHVRKFHPDAPLPAVYRAEGLLRDAEAMRQRLGDEEFFRGLAGSGGTGAWGRLQAWTPETWGEALTALPGSQARARLIRALLGSYFSSYAGVMQGKAETYVDLDEGLQEISRHAHELKYDALILFLDELVLWLASHAGDLIFVQKEGQKLTKLREAQNVDRPAPIVSFVARQRDLRELVGDHILGAAQVNFSDALRHWDGRFHVITLEDRNLPEIASRRLLKPVSDEAARTLDDAFERTVRVRQEVLDVLFSGEGDREMFRKLYPFTPALVETLVAVSSALQRERTALRIMQELLVERRETLQVGQLIPVGDLFDAVCTREEAFTEVLRATVDQARHLYHQKLLPMLEDSNGIELERDRERAATDPEVAERLERFRNDDRLVKTMLLAALAPEVKSLRNLNATRLEALNRGAVRSVIPNQEASAVLRRVREWASRVGEIRIEEGSRDPLLSIHLSGVDVDSILSQVTREDNEGNRQRMLKELVYEALGVAEPAQGELFQRHPIPWRRSKREVQLVFGNVREMTREVVANPSETWKLVLDFPFDRRDFGPREDLHRLHEFRQDQGLAARTMVWLPSFFSQAALTDLGQLVKIEFVLKGDRFTQHTTHLSTSDRPIARTLLENQRSALRQKLRTYLEAAYGIRPEIEGALSRSHLLEKSEQVQSLQPGFSPRPPLGADLAEALADLLDQALAAQYPGHPLFEGEGEIRTSHLRSLWPTLQKALAAPEGRLLVEDRPLRKALREIAVPLELGEMGETHFLPSRHWRDTFVRRAADEGRRPVTVADLFRWIDEPRPTGLAPHLKALVVLYYAAQTHQGFRLGGTLREPDFDEVRPEMELVEHRLPTEDEWNRALQLLQDQLEERGLPSQRTPAGVDRVARRLNERLASKLPAHREFTDALREAWRRLSPLLSLGDIEAAERWRTAGHTNSWLSSWEGAEAHEVVRQFAAAPARPTLAAVARGLDHAERSSRQLKALRMPAFETLHDLATGHGPSGLPPERAHEARMLLDEVANALRNDEYVTALVPVLERAESASFELIRPPRPEPKPGNGEPRPPQRKQKESRQARDLPASEARRQLEELLARLEDAQRVDLTWTVWEEA